MNMRIDGRYTLVGPLGAGGMGSVWEVQRDDGRRFAMKRIATGAMLYKESHERFTREVKVAAAIKHPHVVEVVDWGIDPTAGPYYVMDLLRGQDLEKYVTRVGRVERAEARRILGEIADALANIHGGNIVHRDLKPSNVFLEGDARRVKVIDFGIAKHLGEGGASVDSTSVIGSPAWMSPEQIEQERIDKRTDLWAFGLLAFYMLTGKCFWISDLSKRAPVLREICVEPIPAASTRAHKLSVGDVLPDGFDGWFSRCVTRQLSDRYPDAKTTFEELRLMTKIRLVHPTPSPAPSIPSIPLDPDEQALSFAIAYLRERVPEAVAAMDRSATLHDGLTPPVPVVSTPRPQAPTPTPPPISAPLIRHAPPVIPLPPAYPPPPSKPQAGSSPAPIVPAHSQMVVRPPNKPDLLVTLAITAAVILAIFMAIAALTALAQEPSPEPPLPPQSAAYGPGRLFGRSDAFGAVSRLWVFCTFPSQRRFQ